MPTQQEYQAQDDAAMAQMATARSAQHAQETLQGGQQPEPTFLQKWVTGPLGRVSTSMMDSAVSAADSIYDTPGMEKARDVTAGAITGATNIADTAVKAATTNFSMGADGKAQESQSSPIWDHAKSAILDFRDAVAVKDPTLTDGLLQGAAQLAIPFAGYSRALAGVHGVASVVAAGAATDATALAPHDPRMADMLALGRHTEGKLGDALRAMAPDGSAFNSYINYLTDRTNETDAQGRWKNVLDGFGANLVATPLIHAAGIILKQGTTGLRYAIDNGVGSAGALMPANQVGKIGYHGTPHDFDATAGFDNSKIGSGEGAQVYGYGHYLAESPDVAKGYQSRLAQQSFQKDDPMGLAQRLLDPNDGALTKQQAVVELNRRADTATDPNFKMKAQKAAQLIKSGATDRGSGSLITADVADRHVDAMLDWDKPLSEQSLPQPVLDKIQDIKDNDPHLASVLDKDATGADLHMVLQHTMGPAGAAKWLDASGIPGIKYLDGNSRKEGEGTRNLVVFDGNKIDVREKNGKPVRGAPIDMNLSKEERAIERERVAAARDREEGNRREFEPEPVPRNAAEREGAAARRRKDD